MAQKHIVQLVDDLSGDAASETVTFALDGARYEIDLSEENAVRLRESLAVFIAGARRPRALRSTSVELVRHDFKRADTTRAHRERTAAVRRWARSNGFRIGEKGRIPARVVTAYREAHRG